jgi:hypothetical protein
VSPGGGRLMRRVRIDSGEWEIASEILTLAFPGPVVSVEIPPKPVAQAPLPLQRPRILGWALMPCRDRDKRQAWEHPLD